jgi:hypothetical protein
MPKIPRRALVAAALVPAALAAALATAGATLGAPEPSVTGTAADGLTAGPTAEGRDAHWRKIAQGPLSPRFRAQLVWTGKEAIVFGGDLRGCPTDDDSCEQVPGNPLADGAAYDPGTDAWRQIAPMPHRYHHPQPVLAGQTVYALSQKTEPGTSDIANRYFLAYSIATDSWRVLPPPKAGTDRLELAAVGGKVIAYRLFAGKADRDFIWSEQDNAWHRLPAYSQARMGYRKVLDVAGRAVVVGRSPSGEYLRAARLDLRTRTWTRLPKLGPHTSARPDFCAAAAGRIACLPPYDEDAAILDPSGDGAWTLTKPTVEQGSPVFVAAAQGDLAAYFGRVLNVRTGGWTRIEREPKVADGLLWGHVAGWAGDALFFWGGALYDERQFPGEPRNEGWTWKP